MTTKKVANWPFIILITIGVLFMIAVQAFVPSFINLKNDNPDTIVVEQKVYVDTGNLFTEAITHLKEYEGFRSHMYYDVDGSKTIGYGHHFRNNEDFISITESEATEILVEDLKRKIDYVEEHTDLRDNQSLALGLFAFNLGTGNFDKAISGGLLDNIHRITDYCHYKVTENGETIVKKSQKLYERRQFELYLYTR